MGTLNGVAPHAWLRDVIARISDHPQSRLHELLPWHWKRLREQAQQPVAQAARPLLSTSRAKPDGLHRMRTSHQREWEYIDDLAGCVLPLHRALDHIANNGVFWIWT